MFTLRRQSILRPLGFIGEGIRYSSVFSTGRGIVESEDWRYVGDPGEPSYGADWGPPQVGGYTKLRFRALASGYVMFAGVTQSKIVGSLPTSVIFTLPIDRAPQQFEWHTVMIRNDNSGQIGHAAMFFNSNGDVSIPFGIHAGLNVGTSARMQVFFDDQFYWLPA